MTQSLDFQNKEAIQLCNDLCLEPPNLPPTPRLALSLHSSAVNMRFNRNTSMGFPSSTDLNISVNCGIFSIFKIPISKIKIPAKNTTEKLVPRK